MSLFQYFEAGVARQSLNADISACFTQPQGLSVYEGPMIARIASSPPLPRAAAVAALFLLGIGLAGCANVGDSVSLAFVDPARYDYYDCPGLETEQKNLAKQIEELQARMAKAETGAAGPVVAELAYRNDYISARGQAKLAEQTWQRNKCHESPPTAAATAPGLSAVPPANAKGPRPPVRSGSAIY
jgi:hypothetical protein